MASATSIQLVTDLRDTTLRLLQTAGTTQAQDPSAWQFVNAATAWLLTPDADSSTPAYGYATTIAGVNTHVMVDDLRRVWKFDTATKKFVLL